MSQTPHVVRNARFGIPLGAPYAFEDALWTGLTDTYCKLPMALTAEKLAEVYKVTRQEVDAFALRSQTLWKQGNYNEIKKMLPSQIKINLICATMFIVLNL